MGWRNVVLSELDHGITYLTEARELMDKTDDEGHHDLDEVVRLVISAQEVTVGALGEIYDSCGPFFPPPKGPLRGEPRATVVVHSATRFRPRCGFVDTIPMEWPEGHVSSGDRNKVNCPGCIAALDERDAKKRA